MTHENSEGPANMGPVRLAPVLRGLIGVVGAGLVTLLAIAAWLEPAEQGFGTHRQLGLPPCTFVAMFGTRCPSCGMTTAWACLMDFRPVDACRANSGGALLAALSLAAGPWLIASAVRGRWVLGALGDRAIVGWSVVILSVTLIDWCCRLSAGPPSSAAGRGPTAVASPPAAR